MAEYTPTTEDVRGAYRAWHDGQGDDHALKPTWSAQEFDRWLAANDAEVRAGVVAEEPEWEYRWAERDGRHAWPFGSGDQELGETIDEVRAAPTREPESSTYFAGTHIERRTKAIPAGPWVPVEQGDKT